MLNNEKTEKLSWIELTRHRLQTVDYYLKKFVRPNRNKFDIAQKFSAYVSDLCRELNNETSEYIEKKYTLKIFNRLMSKFSEEVEDTAENIAIWQAITAYITEVNDLVKIDDPKFLALKGCLARDAFLSSRTDPTKDRYQQDLPKIFVIYDFSSDLDLTLKLSEVLPYFENLGFQIEIDFQENNNWYTQIMESKFILFTSISRLDSIWKEKNNKDKTVYNRLHNIISTSENAEKVCFLSFLKNEEVGQLKVDLEKRRKEENGICQFIYKMSMDNQTFIEEIFKYVGEDITTSPKILNEISRIRNIFSYEELEKKWIEIRGRFVDTLKLPEPKSIVESPVIYQLSEDNPVFSGRKEKLKEIHEKFYQEQGDKKGVKRVLLSGAKGCGKSQIAKHYASYYRTEYEYIFKVELNKIGESFEGIFEDLKRAKKVKGKCPNKPKKIFNVIKNVLSELNNWLLIFDNFWDYENTKEYLPNCPKVNRGHILITANLSNQCQDDIVHIKEFDEFEAIEYVKKCLKNQERQDNEDTASIRLLCKNLSFYPLALTLAVGYLKNCPTQTIGAYANRLKASSTNKDFEELAENKVLTSGLNDYTLTIDQVLQNTLDYIKTEQHGQDAINLLLFLSTIDSNGVQHSLIHDFFNQSKNKLSEEVINNAINILLNFYLLEQIEHKENKLYRAHVITTRLTSLSLSEKEYKSNVIIEIFQKIFDKQEDLATKIDEIIRNAADFFKNKFAYDHNKPKNFSVDLIPHIEIFQKYIKNAEQQLYFLLKLGEFYFFEQRNHNATERFLNAAEKLIIQIGEKKEIEYIEIQLLIYQAILAMERQGMSIAIKKVENAQGKLKEIKPNTEEESKNYSYCNIVIFRVLGQQAGGIGDYFKAKLLLEEAKKLSEEYKRKFISDISVTIEDGFIQGTLARVYAQVGQYKFSLEINEKAIEYKKHWKASTDHDVLVNKLTSIEAKIHLCHFDSALEEIDNYEKGMKNSYPDGGMPSVYQYAIAIQKGWLYLSVGDLKESILSLKNVIEKKFGGSYPREVEAYLPLAYCYFLCGDFRVAKEFLDKINTNDNIGIEALLLKAKILFIQNTPAHEIESIFLQALEKLTNKIAPFEQQYHPLHLKYYLLKGEIAYQENNIEELGAVLEIIEKILSYLSESTRNYTAKSEDIPYHTDYSEYYLLKIKYLSMTNQQKEVVSELNIDHYINEIKRVNDFVFKNYSNCYRVKEVNKIYDIIEHNKKFHNNSVKFSKHPRFSLSVERIKLLQKNDKHALAIKLWLLASLLRKKAITIDFLKKYCTEKVEHYTENKLQETLLFLEEHGFFEKQKLEDDSSSKPVATIDNEANLTKRVRASSRDKAASKSIMYHYEISSDADTIIQEIQLINNHGMEIYSDYQEALRNTSDFLLNNFNYSHGFSENLGYTFILDMDALQKSLEYEKNYSLERMKCLLKLGEYHFFELRDNKKALNFLEELIRIMEVYQLTNEVDYSLLIETYAYTAMAQFELKAIKEAFSYAELAEKHFLNLKKDESNKQHLYYSVIINRMIGQRQSFHSEYVEAKKTLNNAKSAVEKYLQKTGQELDMEMAYIEGTLARIEMFLGNYDEALRLNEKVITYKKKLRGDNDFEVAASYLTVIECNIKLCRYTSAEEALSTFETILNASFKNAVIPPVLHWARDRHKAMYLCEVGKLEEAALLLRKINSETPQEYACRPLISIYLAKIAFLKNDMNEARSNIEVVKGCGNSLLKLEASIISARIALTKGDIGAANKIYMEGMGLGNKIITPSIWNLHPLKLQLYNLKIAIKIHDEFCGSNQDRKKVSDIFKMVESSFLVQKEHVDHANYYLLRSQYLLLKHRTVTKEVLHYMEECHKIYKTVYGEFYTYQPEVKNLFELEDIKTFFEINNLSGSEITEFSLQMFRAIATLDVDSLIDSLSSQDCTKISKTGLSNSNMKQSHFFKRFSEKRVSINKTTQIGGATTMLTTYTDETYSKPFKALVENHTDFMRQLESSPTNYGIPQGGLFEIVIQSFNENKGIINEKPIKKQLELFMGDKNFRSFLKEADNQLGYSAPLYFASKNCFILYSYLTSNGFDKRMTNYQGFGAMHLAVLNKAYDFLKKALSVPGCKLPENDIILSNNLTLKLNPLHLAVMNDDFKAVELFFTKDIKKGIPLIEHEHAVPFVGNIINLAVIFSNQEMVQFLLIQSYKSKETLTQLLTTKDSKEKLSPLEWAAKLGKIDIVDFFLRFSSRDATLGDNTLIVQKAFYVATNAGQTEVVKLFLLHGFEPEAKHPDYNKTMLAIQKDYPDIVHIIQNKLEGILDIAYEKPDPKFQVYRNLVFQGGGMKGAIYPYALIHLENMCKSRITHAETMGYQEDEQALLDISSIERVAGTSAGSIFALGCALGLHGEALKRETDYDFGSFLDTPELDNLCQLMQKEDVDLNGVLETLVGLDKGGTLAALVTQVKEMIDTYNKIADEKGNVDIWQVAKHPMYSKEIYNKAMALKGMLPDIAKALEKQNADFKGFSKGTAIYNWIKAFMIKQGIENPETFTFGDLARYIRGGKTHPQTGLPYKHLHVVVTSLEANVPVVLSSESLNSEYANYVILDAIRASMSIPVAFEPWPLACVSSTGRTLTTQLFVDGGVLTNYPVTLFDKKVFVDNSAIGNAGHPLLNKATLGFSFIAGAITPLEKEYTLKDFLQHMAMMYFAAESIIAAFEDSSYGRSITLDTGNIGTFSFRKLDANDKKSLDANAKQAVGHYFFPGESIPAPSQKTISKKPIKAVKRLENNPASNEAVAGNKTPSEFYLAAYREAFLWGEKDLLKYLGKSDDKFTQSEAALKKEAANYGYTCDNVPGDGNCFYHVVAKQLNTALKLNFTDDQVQLLGKCLRKLACEHIEQHRRFYQEFLDDTVKLRDQAQDRVWVEDIVITALCYALNINLISVRNDGAEPTINKLPQGVCTLYLGYQVELHYQSLCPMSGDTDRSKQIVLNRKFNEAKTHQLKAPISIETRADLKIKLEGLLEANQTKVQINLLLYNELTQSQRGMSDEAAIQKAMKDSLEIESMGQQPLYEKSSNVGSTIDIEDKPSQENQEKASERFKSTVKNLIENDDFTFVVTRTNKLELRIEFTAKDSVLMTLEETKQHLIPLSKALMTELEKLGLHNKKHYQLKPNWKIIDLQIITTDIATLNRIVAILKDAGQNYWNPTQLANSNVFFKPEKPIVNKDKEELQAGGTDEITCAMQ